MHGFDADKHPCFGLVFKPREVAYLSHLAVVVVIIDQQEDSSASYKPAQIGNLKL